VNEQRKIKVAVVFGGRGPEHQVSCMGGGNMLGSIDRSRYEVIPVGITTDGSWVQVADAPERLAINDGKLPSVESVAESGSPLVPWSGSGTGGVATGDVADPDLVAGGLVASAPAQIPHLFGEVDVVLPVLHGPYGRTGPSRACSRWPACPMSGPACWPAQ